MPLLGGIGAGLIGGVVEGMTWLGTFHSIGVKILRNHAELAGLRSGFMAGDPRLVAMVLRWRSYGGPQIPFAVQKASAALWREETHPIQTREWYVKNFRIAEQILHNRYGDCKDKSALLQALLKALRLARVHGG